MPLCHSVVLLGIVPHPIGIYLYLWLFFQGSVICMMLHTLTLVSPIYPSHSPAFTSPSAWYRISGLELVNHALGTALWIFSFQHATYSTWRAHLSPCLHICHVHESLSWVPPRVIYTLWSSLSYLLYYLVIWSYLLQALFLISWSLLIYMHLVEFPSAYLERLSLDWLTSKVWLRLILALFLILTV